MTMYFPNKNHYFRHPGVMILDIVKNVLGHLADRYGLRLPDSDESDVEFLRVTDRGMELYWHNRLDIFITIDPAERDGD